MYKAIKGIKSALYFQSLIRLVSFICRVSSRLIVIRPHISHHLRRPLNRASLVLLATIPFPIPKERERNIPFHKTCTSWSRRGYRHRRWGSCCALCRCRDSGICSIKYEIQVVSTGVSWIIPWMGFGCPYGL